MSSEHLWMLQLCPSPVKSIIPIHVLRQFLELEPLILRNSSANLLAAKQFLGEKIYFAEFMKPYICSFLHSIWLDPEAKNQAGIAKRLYIHLSAGCMQGHPALLPIYSHHHYTSFDVLLSSYLHAIHFSIFMG